MKSPRKPQPGRGQSPIRTRTAWPLSREIAALAFVLSCTDPETIPQERSGRFDGGQSNRSVSVNWGKWAKEVRECTLERLRVGMMADQGPQLPATAQGGWVPGYLITGTRLSISPIVGEASAMTLQAKKNMRLVTKERSSLQSHPLGSENTTYLSSVSGLEHYGLEQLQAFTMSAIGSLVFCTDCGNLLPASKGSSKNILQCECCGAENRGE